MEVPSTVRLHVDNPWCVALAFLATAASLSPPPAAAAHPAAPPGSTSFVKAEKPSKAGSQKANRFWCSKVRSRAVRPVRSPTHAAGSTLVISGTILLAAALFPAHLHPRPSGSGGRALHALVLHVRRYPNFAQFLETEVPPPHASRQVTPFSCRAGAGPNVTGHHVAGIRCRAQPRIARSCCKP
jgi:hypothetical protein